MILSWYKQHFRYGTKVAVLHFIINMAVHTWKAWHAMADTHREEPHQNPNKIVLFSWTFLDG